MKPTLYIFQGASASTLGLIVALAGCAHVPTRHATTETPPPPVYADWLGTGEGPTPVQTVSPEYPYEMRQAGLTGLVNVQCLIDEFGKARELKVADTTDHRLISPTLSALEQWTFKPGRREGLPVTTRVAIPFIYSFNPD
jgi:protein TonB